MNAAEIREIRKLPGGNEQLVLLAFVEIAAQLAELNESLRLLMTKCDQGFCLDVRDIGRKKD